MRQVLGKRINCVRVRTTSEQLSELCGVNAVQGIGNQKLHMTVLAPVRELQLSL